MCKGIKVSNTCLSKTNTNCVEYEGKIKNSGIESECTRLTEIIDDIYEKISDKDTSEIDEIKDRLASVESRLKNLEDIKKDNSVCNMTVRDCDIDLSDLVDICGQEANPETLGELLQLIINNINRR